MEFSNLLLLWCIRTATRENKKLLKLLNCHFLSRKVKNFFFKCFEALDILIFFVFVDKIMHIFEPPHLLDHQGTYLETTFKYTVCNDPLIFTQLLFALPSSVERAAACGTYDHGICRDIPYRITGHPYASYTSCPLLCFYSLVIIAVFFMSRRQFTSIIGIHHDLL